jgi:hypothetical protein
LSAIAAANTANPDHHQRPFFRSPIMNASVVLKHRVRSDETYMFGDVRSIATKIIVPFDVKDFRTGGRSLLVDQRGYVEALRALGNYGGEDFNRDLGILRILDKLPSLDPFLMREHLRAAGIKCADCYYEISPADQERMFTFVSREIKRLIELATGTGAGGLSATGRLVSALLSTEVDEKLEPLRMTLDMSPLDFREGVFSWRGFLYYKWCIEELWPTIVEVLREVRVVEAATIKEADTRLLLASAQQKVVERVHAGVQSVRKTLAFYDNAYNDLVENQSPSTFREFLLGAPHLFLNLGENMGGLSHIASFWRYRFPARSRLCLDGEELLSIFQDFVANFATA